MAYATSPDDALNVGMIKKRLSAQQTNATITPTKVTGLDQTTEIGTFVFNYMIRYRSTAAGTGVRFDVNYSGTVTSFVWNQRWVCTSSTASTNAATQNDIAAAGRVIANFASRAKFTTARGNTGSVDTANADMLMIIEGIMVVTAAGNLEIYLGSETGTSVSAQANAVLLVTQIA